MKTSATALFATAILALANLTSSAVISRSNYSIIAASINNEDLQHCSDLTFPSDGSYQVADCTIDPEHIAGFRWSSSPPSLNLTAATSTIANTTLLSARDPARGKPPPPVPETAHLLWREANDAPDDFKQCISGSHDGPASTPAGFEKRRNDFHFLCSSVDKEYVVRRAGHDAKTSPCACSVWSYRTARFQCSSQGYSSGYMRLPRAGAVFEQHFVEGKGRKQAVDEELRSVLEDSSACLHRDVWSAQKMSDLDKSEPLVKCKVDASAMLSRKCWRVTDPQNTWWEK
ncbi:hypothetical protein B2J93_7363 [Marssonina coronariae]|uniref:Uncharacterized protein n=1 Tax=Diplocarpon coronariae TaxID=2795749 RepID=A0A218Z7W2_9HELO|nr:hypothetical protein B2J93_7363 [Marssonina coronariae]